MGFYFEAEMERKLNEKLNACISTLDREFERLLKDLSHVDRTTLTNIRKCLAEFDTIKTEVENENELSEKRVKSLLESSENRIKVMVDILNRKFNEVLESRFPEGYAEEKVDTEVAKAVPKAVSEYVENNEAEILTINNVVHNLGLSETSVLSQLGATNTFNTLFNTELSKNRWNPNALQGGQLNVADGTLTVNPNSNAHTCGFIEVTDKYACITVTSNSGVVEGLYQRVAQYTANKTFIKCSYGGTTPILLDDNCVYVRVSMSKNNYNVYLYFNDDGTLESYIPYTEDIKKIKPAYLPDWTKPVSSFVGKKMCTYGDSITKHGTWQNTVMETLGLSGFQNCGISGINMSGTGSLASDSKINTIDESCDFIVIMAGVNDSVGRAVGTESLENHDIYGVFGAMNLIISKLMYKARINEGYYTDVDYSQITRFSERKEFPIFLCTQPIHTEQTDRDENLYEDIQNAIRKVGELWAIPVIDVNRLSRLNRANMSEEYYSQDGLHPNPNSGKLLGMCIANGLRNNEPYFGY